MIRRFAFSNLSKKSVVRNLNKDIDVTLAKSNLQKLLSVPPEDRLGLMVNIQLVSEMTGSESYKGLYYEAKVKSVAKEQAYFMQLSHISQR
jgi:hypothetical protein